jgi:hypothetical protein
MSPEDLAWVESQLQEVKLEKSSQKTRNYTLKEKKAVYTPTVKLRLPVITASDAAIASSLNSFFRESYSKHHPGHTPEEDAWEQDC